LDAEPIGPVETLDPGCAGDENRLSQTNEEAVFDHAHHPADALFEPSGIGDGPKGAV